MWLHHTGTAYSAALLLVLSSIAHTGVEAAVISSRHSTRANSSTPITSPRTGSMTAIRFSSTSSLSDSGRFTSQSSALPVGLGPPIALGPPVAPPPAYNPAPAPQTSVSVYSPAIAPQAPSSVYSSASASQASILAYSTRSSASRVTKGEPGSRSTGFAGTTSSGSGVKITSSLAATPTPDATKTRLASSTTNAAVGLWGFFSQMEGIASSALRSSSALAVTTTKSNAIVYASETPNCSGNSENRAVNRTSILGFIKEYCQDAPSFNLPPGRNVVKTYPNPAGTSENELDFAVDASATAVPTIDSNTCETIFGRIVDGCNTQTNVWKQGGSIKVGSVTFTWNIVATDKPYTSFNTDKYTNGWTGMTKSEWTQCAKKTVCDQNFNYTYPTSNTKVDLFQNFQHCGNNKDYDVSWGFRYVNQDGCISPPGEDLVIYDPKYSGTVKIAGDSCVDLLVPSDLNDDDKSFGGIAINDSGMGCWEVLAVAMFQNNTKLITW